LPTNPKILIVKNVTREGQGLLENVLEEKKIPFRIIDLQKNEKFPALEDFSALVVLGGPDSANDESEKIREERGFVKKALESGMPYLGICLGMQILVKAAGGSVVKNPVRECGFRDHDGKFFSIELTDHGKKDPLLAGLPESFHIFQLHGETVEVSDNMHVLARGKHCAHQIVKIAPRTYGIQGHPELNHYLFQQWSKEDPDLNTLEKSQLHKDFEALCPAYENTGRRIFENFLAMI